MSKKTAERKVLRKERSMKERIFEADTVLTNIEIAVLKAWTVNSDLGNTYFFESNPTEYVLQTYYEDAMTRNNIVSDYLCKVSEELLELRQLFSEEETGAEE